MKKIIVLIIGTLGFSNILYANQFSKVGCNRDLDPGWQCVTVQKNDSWNKLFPDSDYQLLVQKYNRQNKWLMTGQKLVLPPRLMSWDNLSPFSQTINTENNDLIIFDPRQLAWAHYMKGRLVRWGPAVGGKNYCPDTGRSCRTEVGVFYFTEAASVRRTSSDYPKKCKSKKDVKCSPIPFFIRFTSSGQGIHERSMRGAHASHGCVGVFADDAKYINNHIRSVVGRRIYGYFSTLQREISRASVIFKVLPY